MLDASAVLGYAILAENNLRSNMPVEAIMGAGLDKIIALCRQEILEQSVKAVGGSTLLKRTKAAQKMLSGLAEYQLAKAGAVIKTAPDGTTYQSFSNGFFGFALKDELQGLPQGDPDNSLDMGEHIRTTESQMNERQETEVDFAAIKAHIVEYKAEHKGERYFAPAIWKLGNQGYNAQYILDCYAILGGDIKFYQDNSRSLTPAILESENGKALLLPVRMPKAKEIKIC